MNKLAAVLVAVLAAPAGALAQPACEATQIDQGVAAVEAGEYEPALTLLLPCAEAGDPRAQTAVGDFSYFGRVVAHDLAEAARWYALAADQGFADAQYYLGQMYLNGMGLAQSDAEAVRLYQLAAAQGHREARYELGVLYLSGFGVVASDEEALRLFRLAAGQGLGAAYYRIGGMYEFGRAVERDTVEARRAYEQGAELGSSDAMVAIGSMYLTGAGGTVERSDVEAYFWLGLAAAYGSQRAGGRRTELEFTLSDEQLRAVADRIVAWMQAH